MNNEHGITNLETVLIAFAMVIVGGLAVWFTFGGVIINITNTIGGL